MNNTVLLNINIYRLFRTITIFLCLLNYLNSQFDFSDPFALQDTEEFDAPKLIDNEPLETDHGTEFPKNIFSSNNIMAEGPQRSDIDPSMEANNRFSSDISTSQFSNPLPPNNILKTNKDQIKNTGLSIESILNQDKKSEESTINPLTHISIPQIPKLDITDQSINNTPNNDKFKEIKMNQINKQIDEQIKNKVEQVPKKINNLLRDEIQDNNKLQAAENSNSQNNIDINKNIFQNVNHNNKEISDGIRDTKLSKNVKNDQPKQNLNSIDNTLDPLTKQDKTDKALALPISSENDLNKNQNVSLFNQTNVNIDSEKNNNSNKNETRNESIKSNNNTDINLQNRKHIMNSNKTDTESTKSTDLTKETSESESTRMRIVNNTKFININEEDLQPLTDLESNSGSNEETNVKSSSKKTDLKSNNINLKKTQQEKLIQNNSNRPTLQKMPVVFRKPETINDKHIKFDKDNSNASIKTKLKINSNDKENKALSSAQKSCHNLMILFFLSSLGVVNT